MVQQECWDRVKMSSNLAQRLPTPLERHKDGVSLLNHKPHNQNLWTPIHDKTAAFFEDGQLYLSEHIRTSVEAGHLINTARKKIEDIEYHFVPDSELKELHTFLNKANVNTDTIESDAESLRAFKNLLIEADQRGASDIHLFIRQNTLHVKFRVNTLLENGESYQADFGKALIQVIYYQSDQKEQSFNEIGPMAAKMNLRKLGINVSYETARLNWQVNTNGHECVIRLQPPLPTSRLSVLGYNEQQVRDFKELRDNTQGTHIFCGPTGSGKSTIQHILCKLQYEECRGEKKFKGFADPEEFFMPFEQISITVGNDPDKRMKALLDCFAAEMRMDIDYANFGEIRDKATAEAILKFTQSGHFAWASMHAVTPDRIIPQLREMGVESLSLFESSVVSTGIGQRLLPKLCSCAKPLASKKSEDAKASFNRFKPLGFELRALKTRNEDGCNKCRNGIVGMTPVLEFLKFDEEIMGLYREKKDHEVLGVLREKKVASFWDNAVDKLISGEIDPIFMERVFGYVKAENFRSTEIKKAS